jgi:DNA-binding PadR family transcriptional regulator
MDDHHHGRRHRHGHGHRRGGGHKRRFFDYGELRLLLLTMIADRPYHGYELIKAIEDHFGGRYSPSPGVIYPTLSWLDDMGYAAIAAEEGGRKSYRITQEGQAFLAANRETADALLSRVRSAGAEAPPPQLVRAMENLKLALNLRLERGHPDEATIDTIAATLDAAAQKIEKS